MNLELTEEQDMVVGMVRRFVREEILPLELDLDPDADEIRPDDRERLIEKTKSMGLYGLGIPCLLYTSPSPRDLSTSRMPSSA